MAYKILVVDDEAHYADMLRDLLLQHNFIADMAVSVQQALDDLDTEDYALIIADYKMPGMDGAEFLQRVRLCNATIPFIMVSGLMNTHELIRVANLGATLVFEKPLEIRSFIESVKRFVSPLSDSEFQKRFRGDVSGESYPAELAHLSDRSHLGKEFVQRLWLAFQRERLTILGLRPGAELELIAKELSHWKGRDNAQFYTVSPEDFANPDCAEALNGIIHDPTVSPVVILQGIEKATRDQMGALADFITGGHFATRLHPDLFFIVALDAAGWSASVAEANPRLHRILQSRILALPPLHERPSDIARYARRLISAAAQAGSVEKSLLAPDAVGLILQYPWPGEYEELFAKLHQIVALEKHGPVRAVELASILSEAIPTSQHGGYTLQTRLHLAQNEAIESALATFGGDLPRALARMGVPGNLLEYTGSEELLFPELLK